MTSKTTSFVLVVLLALLVGYVIGTERAGSSPSAWAGPTQSPNGFNGDYLIGNNETGSLVVWKFADGAAFEARRYVLFSARGEDAKGQPTVNAGFSDQTYYRGGVPPARAGK